MQVDVVIPVHNALDLTRRCIESLYSRVHQGLGNVQVQNDASDPPTAAMLEALDLPRLYVHHESVNTGFGEAVNRAVARTRTPYVLLLNSDLEFCNDFLPPLVAALDADERLAAVSPAGNELHGYDLERYKRRAGCVVSNTLWGYAFLMRRQAFTEVGGFDPLFGRGYYEDLDISRRLLEKGWWLAVHPDSHVIHHKHGSFKSVPEADEVFKRNRLLYLERYPEARRQVLLVTGAVGMHEFPETLTREVEAVLRDGGGAWWFHRGSPPNLSALPLRSKPLGLFRSLRMVARRRRKGRREFTDLWLLEGTPRHSIALLSRLGNYWGLVVRRISLDPERSPCR